MWKAIKVGGTWKCAEINNVEDEAENLQEHVNDSYPVLLFKNREDILDIITEDNIEYIEY